MQLSEQLQFLKDLQEELNTQDHQGQADPRFWVVREKVRESCWDDNCDDYDLYDTQEGKVIGTVDHEVTTDRFYTIPMHSVERNAPNTLFITLRGAQEHIKLNSYHYTNPHTYAMTARRSPQVEKLWEILQTMDWGAVQAALEGEKAVSGNE